MQRRWKLLVLALCVGSVLVAIVISAGLSFSGIAPGAALTIQQQQTSVYGRAMQEALLLPTQWLLGETVGSVLFAWIFWSVTLYFLVCGVWRLVGFICLRARALIPGTQRA